MEFQNIVMACDSPREIDSPHRLSVRSRSELLLARKSETMQQTAIWAQKASQKLEESVQLRLDGLKLATKVSRVNDESTQFQRSVSMKRTFPQLHDTECSLLAREPIVDVRAVPTHGHVRCLHTKRLRRNSVIAMKPGSVGHPSIHPQRLPLHNIYIHAAFNERTGLNYPPEIVPLYSSFSGDKTFRPEYHAILRKAKRIVKERQLQEKATQDAERVEILSSVAPPKLSPRSHLPPRPPPRPGSANVAAGPPPPPPPPAVAVGQTTRAIPTNSTTVAVGPQPVAVPLLVGIPPPPPPPTVAVVTATRATTPMYSIVGRETHRAGTGTQSSAGISTENVTPRPPSSLPPRSAGRARPYTAR